MKFGVNTFVWVSPCTTEAIRDLAPAVRSMGFDLLEISVEDPALIDVTEVKEILAKNQLSTVICGAFGPDRNLCSTNPVYRQNARQYILWLIDAAAELGADNRLWTNVFSSRKGTSGGPGGKTGRMAARGVRRSGIGGCCAREKRQAGARGSKQI